MKDYTVLLHRIRKIGLKAIIEGCERDLALLRKLLAIENELKRNASITDYFLFKSSMIGQSDRYFIISPFAYHKEEIRAMLADSKLADPKFVAVYMRDGINAIRLIPKLIGKKQSRFIKFIDLIEGNTTRTAIKGMINVLLRTFPDIPLNVIAYYKIRSYKYDNSEEDTDIQLRPYETIRW